MLHGYIDIPTIYFFEEKNIWTGSVFNEFNYRIMPVENEKGEKEPMEVKVGDIVLYAKYAGTEVKIDGVEYKILSIKDALAVIE